MIHYFVSVICQKAREIMTLDLPARTINVFGSYHVQSSALFQWIHVMAVFMCSAALKE